MIRQALSILALGLCTLSATAFDFNYKQQTDGPLQRWGSGKADTYDVAVRVDAPALAGRRITGFTVPLAANVKNISGWLSTELVLKKSSGVTSNCPDIATQEAEVEDGILSVTFDEPYTLTAEGVYVGYSFQIETATDADSKKPVACYKGVDTDALWVHTRKSYFSWTPMSEDAGLVSAISISIEGELQPYALSICDVAEAYAAKGEPIVADVQIRNHGTEPVSSLAYRYTAAGSEYEGTYTMPEPLPPLYNATVAVKLPLPAADVLGEYTASLALTSAEGNANAEAAPAEFPLYILSFKPHKRVVMEEATGTWCGWCPRGMASMEHLSHDFPDDFVAIAYHSDDEMTTSAQPPLNVSSLPNCIMDRTWEGDPGYPVALEQFQKLSSERPVANIDVIASLEDEKISCRSTTIFTKSMPKASYRVAYMLLADGLHNEKWIQSNSYHGLQDRVEQDSYLQRFVDAPGRIPDFVYADVMVYCKDTGGITSSLPKEITGDTPIEHVHAIPLSGVVTRTGASLMQEDADYRVAALLIDTSTGKVVNAAQCPVTGLNSVRAINAERVGTSAEYYSLQGVRLAEPPSSGIYIEVRGSRAVKRWK